MSSNPQSQNSWMFFLQLLRMSKLSPLRALISWVQSTLELDSFFDRVGSWFRLGFGVSCGSSFMVRVKVMNKV